MVIKYKLTVDYLIFHLADTLQKKLCIFAFYRSQWPRGLRRGSTAARLVGLWVRIPPGAWMFVLSVVCCQVEVSATG